MIDTGINGSEPNKNYFKHRGLEQIQLPQVMVEMQQAVKIVIRRKLRFI